MHLTQPRVALLPFPASHVEGMLRDARKLCEEAKSNESL